MWVREEKGKWSRFASDRLLYTMEIGEISPLVERPSVARPQKAPCRPKTTLGGIHVVSITLHLVAIAAWR